MEQDNKKSTTNKFKIKKLAIQLVYLKILIQYDLKEGLDVHDLFIPNNQQCRKPESLVAQNIAKYLG